MWGELLISEWYCETLLIVELILNIGSWSFFFIFSFKIHKICHEICMRSSSTIDSLELSLSNAISSWEELFIPLLIFSSAFLGSFYVWSFCEISLSSRVVPHIILAHKKLWRLSEILAQKRWNVSCGGVAVKYLLWNEICEKYFSKILRMQLVKYVCKASLKYWQLDLKVTL